MSSTPQPPPQPLARRSSRPVTFVRVVLRKAVRELHGKTDLWSGIVGAALTAGAWMIAKTRPHWISTELTDLLQTLPPFFYFAAILLALFLGRLFLAPYWLYAELADKLDALQAAAGERTARLSQAAGLAALVSDGSSVYKHASHNPRWEPAERIATFRKSVNTVISTLDYPALYFARLNDAESRIEPEPEDWHSMTIDPSPRERRVQLKRLRASLDTLTQFIDELKVEPQPPPPKASSPD